MRPGLRNRAQARGIDDEADDFPEGQQQQKRGHTAHVAVGDRSNGGMSFSPKVLKSGVRGKISFLYIPRMYSKKNPFKRLFS